MGSLNYLAIIVGTVVMFAAGGLWYSPMLFAKKWVAYLGRTQDGMKNESKPSLFVVGFVTAFLQAYVLARVLHYAQAETLARGALIGALCWVGFTGAPSYTTQVNFAGRPFGLWAIDSGYNLFCYLVAGAILAVWH